MIKELQKDFYEYMSLGLPNVTDILQDVKTNGDTAVMQYTKQFDNQDLSRFRLTSDEIKQAYEKVRPEDIEAVKVAAENIRLFAQEQLESLKSFQVERNGMILGQRIVPLESVGCYVPGGYYPLPSSALMSVIPAKVAGVKEVIVCSPKIKPITIVAADIAGADSIFCIGGVQAIGAMAYGTETVPKVAKIVGPGNAYVTAAKKEVFGIVGIDFIAGPSEVLIIADQTADPALIAADMLAQAEHDPDARADLLTDSREIAKAVEAEVEKQLEELKTKDIAKKALSNSSIVLAESLQEAVNIANKRAPEHLELQVKESDRLVPLLINYGSLFIGSYSAEVFGDYCAGTNHILPTNGAARYTGGLSVKDFVKVLTFQQFTREGAQNLSKVCQSLAEMEGLDAHRLAAKQRE
ncbi:MAG: histidinol dehydrogenase [Candidatus Woesearchaeota archaeon]